VVIFVSIISPFKEGPQAALFKNPVRTAL